MYATREILVRIHTQYNEHVIRHPTINQASQNALRGYVLPLVPGAAEFERLDHGSIVFRSLPPNRTMAMRRIHLCWVNHYEIEEEKANCAISRCAGPGSSIMR